VVELAAVVLPHSSMVCAHGTRIKLSTILSVRSLYTWRRRTASTRGSSRGLTSSEKSELEAAKRRIAALEAELAVHRRASELLGKVVPPKGGSRPWR
jgi:hypothetical protein